MTGLRRTQAGAAIPVSIVQKRTEAGAVVPVEVQGDVVMGNELAAHAALTSGVHGLPVASGVSLSDYQHVAVVDTGSASGTYPTQAVAAAAITDDDATHRYYVFVFGESIDWSVWRSRPYITPIGRDANDVPFVIADYTWSNQGASTVSQAAQCVVLNCEKSGSANHSHRYLLKALNPAINRMYTLHARLVGISTTHLFGLVIWSAAGMVVIGSNKTASGQPTLGVLTVASDTSAPAVLASSIVLHAATSDVYLRMIVIDNTATFEVSRDGDTWVVVYDGYPLSEVGAEFTHIGVLCDSASATAPGVLEIRGWCEL